MKDPRTAANILKKGRGRPLPEFASDIAFAEQIGMKAWEIDAMPYAWYLRYQIFFQAREQAQKGRT